MKKKGWGCFFLKERNLAIYSGGGVLFSFYFLPELIFLSFVPILWAMYKRGGGFSLGFLMGVIFGVGLMYWVLVIDAPTPLWLYLGGVLLFIYYGLVFGISLWWSTWCRCFPLVPFVWVGVEFLRSLTPEIGFPWGTLGYALVHRLPFLQVAEITGIEGVSFFIMSVNLLIFYAIKKRKWKYGIGVIGVVVGMWGYGRYLLHRVEGGEKIRVAVLQANILPEYKKRGEFEYRLNLLHKLSENLDCDLIVMPESALPGYLNLEENRKKIKEKFSKIGTPIVLGGVRLDTVGGIKVYNSSFFLSPMGDIFGFYDKIYLVPFGERLPFDDIIPFLRGIEFGQGNFSKGKEYKVFTLKHNLLFSILICFESIFPRISRKFVKNGANFLVNITDDCWFKNTPGPYQHANQAVVRAIEYRVPLIRCANTGISYIVDKRGKILSKTKLFERVVMVKEVEVGGERETVYTKYGDWLGWLCVGVMVMGVIIRRWRK